MLPSFSLWSSYELQGGKGLCLVHQHIPAPSAESGAPQASSNSFLTAGCWHLHLKVALSTWLAACRREGGTVLLQPSECLLSQWSCNGHFSAILANTGLTLAIISLQSALTLIHTRSFLVEKSNSEWLLRERELVGVFSWKVEE